MDGRAICRVMLNSYSALEDKCRVIDKHIYITAVHSAFRNTMDTCRDIEQMTKEKIAYINTKVIIDQALEKLNNKYELVQHVIKGIKEEQLATTLNTSKYMIRWKVAYQRDKLYEAMLRAYSAEELLDIIYDSEWLMKKYKREAELSLKRSLRRATK